MTSCCSPRALNRSIDYKCDAWVACDETGVPVAALEARSRCSCGEAGWSFLVLGDGRQVVRMIPHRVSIQLGRPLGPESIAAVVDVLSREVVSLIADRTA